MENYFYTKRRFIKFCNKVKGTATYVTPFMDVQDICQLDLDGLNDVCVDDIVEDGYILSDITYKANAVNKKGQVSIKVFVNDASEWIDMYINPVKED